MDKNIDEYKDLISVIVPVYNVKQYLDECIQSLVWQTYNKLEIIIVDDGSTDGSGELCDKWARADSRIKVIHKENGGLGNARNVGLTYVTGQFVGFVDSDDKIELNMYEKLLALCKEHKADIAICAFKNWKNGSEFLDDCQILENKVYRKLDYVEDYYLKKRKLPTSAWSKLYRYEIVKDLVFAEGRIYEDILFTCNALYRCNIIAYTSEPMYFYRREGNTITLSDISLKKITDMFELKYEEAQFWENKQKTIALKLYSQLLINNSVLYGAYRIRGNQHREICVNLRKYNQKIIEQKKNLLFLQKWTKCLKLIVALKTPMLFWIMNKLVRLIRGRLHGAE